MADEHRSGQLTEHTEDLGTRSTQLAKRSRTNWARYILLIIITIAFFVLNQPFNFASAFVFIMLVLGTPIFEFLYRYIDVLNPILERGVSRTNSWLLKWLPKVKIDTQIYADIMEAIKRRFKRITVIAIIMIFIAELFYPAMHSLLASQLASLNDMLCVSPNVPLQASCGNGLGVESLSTDYGTISIGLINQGGPFDYSSMKSAEAKVEALIFQQNATACNDSTRHITLVFVTMLSRTVDDVVLSAQTGLDDMHGVYIAQKDYNSVKEHQTKLCLVIGNIGTRLTSAQAVPLVLQRLVRYSKYDPNFRGVVGFPFSGSAQVATDTLRAWGQTGFPVVSPSATSDLLNNIKNFYRVVSPNMDQSEMMVQFVQQAYDTLHKPAPINIAVLSDSSDTYSKSLHDDFMENVARDKPNINTFSENYEIENPASLDTPLKDALKHNADFIYFAGYAYDLDALEGKLQALEDPKAPPISILGGDGLYDLSRYINNTYSIVYSTVYASPLKSNDPFVTEYDGLFDPTPLRSAVQAQYSLLPPHVIEAYDATTTYLKAVDDLLSREKDLTLENLNGSLATISFTGKSGDITFQGNANSSNPLAKPIYVLCADRNHTLQPAAQSVPGQPITFSLPNIPNCSS